MWLQLIPAMFRRWLQLSLLGLLTGMATQAGRPSPFRVTPALVTTAAGWDLAVDFDFPPRHYLYADRLAFSIEGRPGSPDFQLPPPAPPTGGERQPQFRQGFTARSCQTGSPPPALVLSVFLHGCDPDNCYFPEVRRFRLTPGAAAIELPPELTSPGPPEPPRWRLVADGFSVATRTGFADAADFRRFVQQARVAGAAVSPVRHAGIPWWLTGGMAIAALGWTTLRGGQGRRWPAVLIAVVLAGIGVRSYQRSSGTAGAPADWVALDFAANSLAEDELADLLSRALDRGSPVLLALRPGDAKASSAESWGGARGSGELTGLQTVHLRLADASDPRARELCRYFAVAQPPVFALLVPRNQVKAGLAPNLPPGDRFMPPP